MPNGTEDERRRRVNIPGQQGILERAYTGARELLTPDLSPEAARLAGQISTGPDLGQRAARAVDVGLAKGVELGVRGAQAMGLEAPSPAEVGRSFMGSVEEQVDRFFPTSPEAQELIRKKRTAPITPPGGTPAPSRMAQVPSPGGTPTPIIAPGAESMLAPGAMAAPAPGAMTAPALGPALAPGPGVSQRPAAPKEQLDPVAVAAGLQDSGYPEIWNGRQLTLVGAPPELQAKITAAGLEMERQENIRALNDAIENAAFTATNRLATPEEKAEAVRALTALAPNIQALGAAAPRMAAPAPAPGAEREATAFGARVGALRTAAEEAFKAASNPELLPAEQAQQAQLAESLMGQLTRLSGGAPGAPGAARMAPTVSPGVIPEPWRGQTGMQALTTQRRTAAALDEIGSGGITPAIVDKYFSTENDESRYIFSRLNSDQRRRVLELRK